MKIAELALAGLAIGAPAVMGNAWLNVGIYKNKECNGKLYGFTNVDVTASFTSFKVLTNIGLGAAAPIPGQCTDLNSFAAELGSITLDAQQTASLAAAVDFPPIAIGFSAYISGQVVMKNLPTILAGSCIPVKSGEETVAYIKGGCTDGTTAPAVPSALTSYAVRTASTTAGCNYDSAYLVQGVVADKNPHKELGGTWQLSSNEQVLVAVSLGLLTQTQGTAQLTSSTKASFPFTTTGTCSGGGNQGPLAANASIAVNVNGIAFTDNLALARARTCTSGSANNVTVYYQTVCRPGGGQPNGGKSLITANAPTNVTKRRKTVA
ncbi:hypothetical protein DFJ77DRAFT_477457 [Powellomyces hirtus]|nr:hypothetical protein DFJ77DRAFT_477457 [Powellomyces hirtus]